jgi:serine protease
MKRVIGIALAALLGAVATAHAIGLPGARDGRIPDQYIVQLHKPAPDHPLAGTSLAAQARQLAAAHGGQVLFVYEHALRGFAVRLPDAAAHALALNPLVASVNPDVRMRAIATQTGATWGLDRSDQRSLPLSGAYTYPDHAGQGVHVYVIDTGLNPDHVEFTGRVGTGRNFVAPLLLLGSPDPADWDDCNGHGTHVSSTAVGTTWGVAKKATIHAVRVLDCLGSGSGAAILAGIDWVAANHQSPAVANLSLGTLNGRSSDQETAVRNLVNANVAVAVAAGNDDEDACNTSPAAEPAVLTTGATSINDARASFSNFGACLDLFAPGASIVAADYGGTTGSTTMSGTSMASPHVAGALALARGGNSALTGAQAQAQVVSETTPGVVTDPGAGSPNTLLYVPNSGGTPVDNPPEAAFTFSCTGLTCSFDAGGSTDDRGIAAYGWAFGDATGGSGATVSHSYAAAGTYPVTLTVTDTVNQTDTATQNVTVSTDGTTAPCGNCTKYTGTLASGGTAYHPGTAGFAFSGGTLKGYLRGPASADFDLYLERYSSGLLGGWSVVARAEGTTSVEDISYSAGSGTYRWRVKSYSGSGSYEFWGEPK